MIIFFKAGGLNHTCHFKLVTCSPNGASKCRRPQFFLTTAVPKSSHFFYINQIGVCLFLGCSISGVISETGRFGKNFQTCCGGNCFNLAAGKKKQRQAWMLAGVITSPQFNSKKTLKSYKALLRGEHRLLFASFFRDEPF